MKYKKEIIWNYISLIVMALAGLLMNTVIVVFYNANALGLFNEVYAWYMVLSQFAVCGIHMAILKFVPENFEWDKKNTFLGTGLVITIATSLICISVAEIVSLSLNDESWRISMSVAYIGLVFFAVNKVLLNYLNAIQRMVAYAVFNSFRYFLLAGILLVLSIIHVDPFWLAAVFPISELCLMIALFAYCFTIVRTRFTFERKIVRQLFGFGIRIFPSNLVLEFNTKLDVICLGFILKDREQIGIYSLAILFAEGFYMLYITIRKLVNPSISESNAQGRLEEKIGEIKEWIGKYVRIGGIIAFIGVVVVYYLYCMVLKKPDHYIGEIYIVLIGIAMVLTGRYIIFGDILAQIGMPSEESLLNLLTVICNLVLNVVLITILGTVGAAIATACSHFVFAFHLRMRVKKRIGLKI